MTILALTLKTWMLIVAVHGHGPNHGHNVTQGSYYNSQSACETAAAEIKMRLNLQGFRPLPLVSKPAGREGVDNPGDVDVCFLIAV